MSLIEKWKNTLDQNGYDRAILTNLSKAFDTINYDVLIAKPGVYDFDTESLKLIKSYLKNRLQRTKIDTSFSSWTKLLLGVPQESGLGSVLIILTIQISTLVT